MIVVRQLHDNEPDILTGSELDILVISGLNDNVLLSVNAIEGWTVASLELMSVVADSVADFFQESGWNAYLGGKWIGSSEV